MWGECLIRYFLLASTLGPPKGFFLVITLCVWDKGTAHAQGNSQILKRCGYPCLPTRNWPDGIGFLTRRPTTNRENQLSSQIELGWSTVKSNEADKDAVEGSFWWRYVFFTGSKKNKNKNIESEPYLSKTHYIEVGS